MAKNTNKLPLAANQYIVDMLASWPSSDANQGTKTATANHSPNSAKVTRKVRDQNVRGAAVCIGELSMPEPFRCADTGKRCLGKPATSGSVR
jgi:hypothetical protein